MIRWGSPTKFYQLGKETGVLFNLLLFHSSSVEEEQVSPAESFNDMCEEESMMESLCGVSGGGGATDPEESDANVDEIDVDVVPKSQREETSAEKTGETGAELVTAQGEGVRGAEDLLQTQGKNERDEVLEAPLVGATCSDTIVLVPSESGSSTAEGVRQ